MFSRKTRAQSAESHFMAPTISSNARTRRATSAEPTVPTNPASIRIILTNTSADSSKASTSAPKSPKLIKRTAKAPSRVQALSSRMGLTLSETPVTSKPVPAKPSQKGLNDATAAPAFEGDWKLQRTSYGDARAAREDQMSAAMAVNAQAKGLIDDETAKNWSTPWHQNGHIELNWSQRIINKYNAKNGIVPEKVMSLKEAKAIKKKKDQDLEEWATSYMIGIIDVNGNQIGSSTVKPTVKPKSWERDARREAAKKDAEKKDPLQKVQEGRVTKKSGSEKTPKLPTIAEASSPAPKLAVKKAAKKTIAKPDQAAPENNPSVGEKKYEAPITPLPGCPSYAEYKYNDLSALCRERNIKSGGDEQALRYRLICDDTFVINGQSHLRDAKNYASRKQHDHPAPVVPNAPDALPAAYKRSAPKNSTAKRARDDDDDDDDQPKPKGKKMKTT